MHIVDYFVIAGYFALVMYLGYYSMKKVSNFDDYAVAGRSMPLPIFFAAIAATLCGGGATIGRISFMHTTGIIVFFALTGVVINQIFSDVYKRQALRRARRENRGGGASWGRARRIYEHPSSDRGTPGTLLHDGHLFRMPRGNRRPAQPSGLPHDCP